MKSILRTMFSYQPIAGLFFTLAYIGLMIISVIMVTNVIDPKHQLLLLALWSFYNFLQWSLVGMTLALLLGELSSELIPRLKEKVQKTILLIMGMTCIVPALVASNNTFLALSLLGITLFIGVTFLYSTLVKGYFLAMFIPFVMAPIISQEKMRFLLDYSPYLSLIAVPTFAYLIFNFKQLDLNNRSINKMKAMYARESQASIKTNTDAFETDNLFKRMMFRANIKQKSHLLDLTNRNEITTKDLIETTFVNPKSIGLNYSIPYFIGILLLLGVAFLILGERQTQGFMNGVFFSVLTGLTFFFLGNYYELLYKSKPILGRLSLSEKFSSGKAFRKEFIELFYIQGLKSNMLIVLCAILFTIAVRMDVKQIITLYLLILANALICLSLLVMILRGRNFNSLLVAMLLFSIPALTAYGFMEFSSIYPDMFLYLSIGASVLAILSKFLVKALWIKSEPDWSVNENAHQYNVFGIKHI